MWRFRHPVPSWHCLAPATQRLSPDRVTDQDTVFVTDAVDTKTPEARLLAADVTMSEIKPVLEAQARVLGHGGEPLLGYSKEAMAAVAKRAAKAMRISPEGLKDNRRQRAEAAEQEKQRWVAMAEPLWAGRYKVRVAHIVAERTGARFSTVYRSLKRPE
jgi:hypothetical protein